MRALVRTAPTSARYSLQLLGWAGRSLPTGPGNAWMQEGACHTRRPEDSAVQIVRHRPRRAGSGPTEDYAPFRAPGGKGGGSSSQNSTRDDDWWAEPPSSMSL